MQITVALLKYYYNSNQMADTKIHILCIIALHLFKQLVNYSKHKMTLHAVNLAATTGIKQENVLCTYTFVFFFLLHFQVSYCFLVFKYRSYVLCVGVTKTELL